MVTKIAHSKGINLKGLDALLKFTTFSATFNCSGTSAMILFYLMTLLRRVFISPLTLSFVLQKKLPKQLKKLFPYLLNCNISTR